MALNHVTEKGLPLNLWEIWLASELKTHKGSVSSISGATETQLPSKHKENSAPRREHGEALCSV